MRRRLLTRAELAAETGISKPTAGESVRRLTDAGLVADTGQRTAGGRGRGRVGSYYSLAADIGTALAVSIAPAGVVAERVDAYGETAARAERELSRPTRPREVAAALRSAAVAAQHGTGVAARQAVVSAADPVQRTTGRLIHLPDAPFLLGELNPAEVLEPVIAGPVIVDNDVNWAARAERGHAPAGELDDFAYVFLGEGLGCAIVSDGHVLRGFNGFAGEVAHLVTAGPHGEAMPLIEVFGELGLRQADSTAIDAGRLLALVTGTTPEAAPVREALGRALRGLVAAIAALADPGIIVIGGSWGTHPVILGTIATAIAGQPRHVSVRAAEVTAEPSLTGARTDAVSRLRAQIIATVRPGQR